MFENIHILLSILDWLELAHASTSLSILSMNKLHSYWGLLWLYMLL